MVVDNTLYIFLILLLGAMLIALTAITLKQRGAETELKSQFLLLQTLVDSIPSPVFYKNSEGVYLGCNSAFLTMLGRTKDEVVGKTVYDLSPPDLAEIYEKADNDLFLQGGVQRYETQVEFADGSIHEMFFTKAVFRDANEGMAGLLGVMLDITERKAAEKELQVAHENLEHQVEERTRALKEAERESRDKSDFLNTVINSINHGIVVIDAEDHTVKLANLAACDGGSTDSKHCYELLHNRIAPCENVVEICPVQQVKRTGKPTITTHNHTTLDGKPKYVEIHTYPVFDESGKVVQVIDNIMDITPRKLAEKAIVDAKEMAESTNRLMSEFLDTVSHELRTPMTSVQGFSKLIQKAFTDKFTPLASDDDKLHKAAQRIESNLAIVISESERMISLINDQLDLSKLQSGRIDWAEIRLSPVEILDRAMNAVTSLFAEDTISLESEMQDNLPMVIGDPNRLMQVLINLISNAAKFTDKGSVRCTVSLKDDFIIFSVSDTGIGIPEDQIKDVFSKFKQVVCKDAGKPAGTGLGLAISKEIVQHHGGRIWAESTVGVGSTFYVSIPVA